MVEPLSEEDRRAGNRLLAIAFILGVTLSAAATAFYSGATAAETGILGAVGAATAVGLLFVMFW